MKKIKLSKDMVALVDDEDFERLNQFKWSASNHGSRGRDKWYAIRRIRVNGKQVGIRMHHEVLGIKPGELAPGEVVDHRDDDGLHNWKTNLVRTTQLRNMHRCPGWRKPLDPESITL